MYSLCFLTLLALSVTADSSACVDSSCVDSSQGFEKTDLDLVLMQQSASLGSLKGKSHRHHLSDDEHYDPAVHSNQELPQRILGLLQSSSVATNPASLASLVIVCLLGCYIIWRDLLSNSKATSAVDVPLTTTVVDVLIVGGGFGGAYSAYQIKKEFPEKKVVVLEKTGRIGGRLMSVKTDPAHGDVSCVKQELGGMRIFPTVMPKVAEMVKAAKCNFVPVPLTDAHNLFYYKGVHYQKGNFKCASGRTLGEANQSCMKNYSQAHPEDKGRDPYLSTELRNLSLPNFLKKYGMTDDEIDAHNVFGGYDLYPTCVSSSIFVKDGELYGSSLSNDQKYVHEGYMTVVERLLSSSKATVHQHTKAIAISESHSSGMVRVVASERNGHTQEYLAKQVLVSLPYDHMTELVQTLDISPVRKSALKDVQMLPLFKCFLEWSADTVWWKDIGFACGKSTTDLDLRQVHYYDSVDLLVYNSGPYAVKWNYRFQEDPGKAARTAFEMLKELHQMPNMPEPIWERTQYKFWADGSHKWKIGANVHESMKTITHGQKDDSSIYLCGDAFSSYQGWVCGAIETADMCLGEMRKSW